MTPRAADRMHDKERERERGLVLAPLIRFLGGWDFLYRLRGKRKSERERGFLTHTMQKERGKKRKRGKGENGIMKFLSLSPTILSSAFSFLFFFIAKTSLPREKKEEKRREEGQ